MADTKLIYKKMLRLVLPISFQQFMLALVGASDAVMLGRLNQDFMSAVSLASQVTFVFNLFMTAFVVGENMFIAQHYGKRDYASISKIFSLVLRISCMMALPFVTGTLFFPMQIILSMIYLKRNLEPEKVCLWNIDRDLKKRFRTKTAPVLLNELAWGVGFTMYSVIMGHLGADSVAANSIANISKNLVVCFCLGLGSGGSIIVGNELGAGHFAEARRIGRILTKASVIGGILSGLLLLALSPVIIGLADLTPDAQKYMSGMFVICSYYLAGKSVNCMTVGGIFPAGGDTRFGLICDTVTLWCITVPLGCICAFVCRFPVMVVYFVLNLDEIVKLPAVYWHYKKYGWVKNIINGGFEHE